MEIKKKPIISTGNEPPLPYLTCRVMNILAWSTHQKTMKKMNSVNHPSQKVKTKLRTQVRILCLKFSLNSLRFSLTRKTDAKTSKHDSNYLAFKETTWVVQQIFLPLNFFERACDAAFSAHSNLLYDDDKYAHRTTICTSLKSKTEQFQRICKLTHRELYDLLYKNRHFLRGNLAKLVLW